MENAAPDESHAAAPDAAPYDALVRVGERFGATVRYDAAAIARFASLCGDANPMHHDPAHAAATRFGGVIACGPQTASAMMGCFASWFSRDDDGFERAVLGTEFNFRFRAPVRPDEDVRIDWRVESREWKPRHSGWLVRVAGTAVTPGGVAVESDGAGLVMQRL